MTATDNAISQKSFLVTGGAGFIGSHIVEHLLNNGAKKVRVLDNFSNGFRKNIAAFVTHPAFELVEGDIRHLADCKSACEGVDLITHQAALGSVPRSLADPLTTNEVNITGFVNMLVAARDAGIKRFVYAASSSTYGDSTSLPKVENKIGNPLSPYAVTKYVNELYASVFAMHYGMECIGLRYFNVFGPKQDPNGAYAAVIPLFIQAVLDNRAPFINGDGLQTRDFTYVSNAVHANIKALLTTNQEAVNQVYNVAVGERTSVKQMLDIISEISGKPITPQYREARKGDVRDSLADVSKARQLLGYNPEVTFRQGIQLTFEWFANNQDFIFKQI
jgi:UDP-N-acetylglucosamine 4-epimerase